MEKMQKAYSHPALKIGFPILFSAPMIFYCVYSGMMMTSLAKDDAWYCTGTNEDGSPIDLNPQYLTMARLCFSTSLILVITNIAGGVLGALNNEGTVAVGMQKLCGMLNCCGAIAFLANCFVIPLTIFSAATDRCIGQGLSEGEILIAKDQKGFKTIWIVMLAVSGGTLVLFFLVCFLVICIAGVAAMKLAKETADKIDAKGIDN